MADIRIKDLATTATDTGSDDFFAIDGSSQGTRKMAARTPVFNSVTGNATTDLTLAGGSSGASLVLGQGANGNATLTPQGTGQINLIESVNFPAGSGNTAFKTGGGSGFSGFIVSNAGASYPFDGTSNLVLQAYADGTAARDLYIATGATSQFAYVFNRTGNLLVGGTTDITGSGGLKVFGTTDASSTGSGSLQTLGGLGVAKAAFIGGNATFGGNLTVSGGTANVTSATEADLYVSKTGTSALSAYFYNQGTGSGGFGLYDGTAPRSVWEYSSAANNFNIKTATLSASGNLTVSGSGTSSVAGNFGIGTTDTAASQLRISGNSDSGSVPNRPRIDLTNLAGTAQTWTIQPWQVSGDANLSIYRTAAAGGILLAPTGGSVGVGITSFSGSGKLELATHTTSAGGIGFGTDTSLFRTAAGQLRGPSAFLDATYSSSGVFFGANMTIAANDNIYLKTNGSTTALTLDSSQGCILAGALRLNNAYTAGAPTATGYVTLQDSAGNTYKVLVGT